MHEIDCGFDTLMSQASKTANTYFQEAHETLENSGLKFTAADVVAFASIAERDYNTSMVFLASQQMRVSVSDLAYDIKNLVDTLEMIREANNK